MASSAGTANTLAPAETMAIPARPDTGGIRPPRARPWEAARGARTETRLPAARKYGAMPRCSATAAASAQAGTAPPTARSAAPLATRSAADTP